MKKTEKNKIRKDIKKEMVDAGTYKPIHDLLINQLVDWYEIDAFTKEQLEEEPTSWTALSTIAVASKNIQSLSTKLQLAPPAPTKTKVVDQPPALEDVIKQITTTK